MPIIEQLIRSSPLCRVAAVPTEISRLPLRLTKLLTFLGTPWKRVLLEKLTGSQLVRKFPSFYGTRRFFTELPSAGHLSPTEMEETLKVSLEKFRFSFSCDGSRDL